MDRLSCVESYPSTIRQEANGPPPPPGEDQEGKRFADSAVRLAGYAGAVLGWSPGAFWRATPAELGAVAAVLAGGSDAVAPPDAGTLAALKEAFPDG